MKHNFTPLDSENEPLAFAELVFENYFLEKTLQCYLTHPTPTASDKQLGLLPRPTDGNETCTFCFSDSSSNDSSSSTSTPNGPCTDELWAMSLDKAGTHDGSRTECISVIRNNGQYMILSFLKFECTNNDVEYEAIVLNTRRTAATNEQSILGTYHDPKMANLGASYTPQ